MIADDLMFAWCWDARPLPEFPLRTDIWSDGADWANGHWLNGKLPSLPPQAPSSAPSFGPFASFPTLIGQGWSSKVTPRFATLAHERASGKSSRRMKMRWPLYEIELTFDFLRGDAATQELQNILGFFESMQGQAQPFWLAPPGLSALTNQLIGTGDGATTVFPMQRATGAFTEPLAGVSSLTAVRVNGAALAPGAWSSSSGYRAQPDARQRAGDRRERQCGRRGLVAVPLCRRRARLRAVRLQLVSLKEREAGDGEIVTPLLPSPVYGRRWPHVVGSDEGRCDLVGTSRQPSSDLASRGHLLPQVGEGRAPMQCEAA